MSSLNASSATKYSDLDICAIPGGDTATEVTAEPTLEYDIVLELGTDVIVWVPLNPESEPFVSVIVIFAFDKTAKPPDEYAPVAELDTTKFVDVADITIAFTKL